MTKQNDIPTLSELRNDYLKMMGERCFNAIDSQDPDVWQDIIKDYAGADKLGRSIKWKMACNWFTTELNESKQFGTDRDVNHLRWIALQGSVWMGYAL
jgi:prephenate dehydrogenase